MVKNVSKESLNPVDEKLSGLKKVIPEVFTEGKIDFEKLQRTLGKDIDGRDEKYSFNWAGRKETFKNIQTTAKGTLKPAEKESVNWDSTENLFIEGDNLEVLKLLQKAYFNKIKMVYIDPPYNTGKDFVYKDNFKNNIQSYLEQTGQSNGDGVKLTTNPETNGRFHSNWISMIYPRLFVARNLLREDGVIFVSIDDNEVHNLRKVMDEIFGEENFVACVTVVGNPGGRDYGGIARMHDYILIYKKSEEAEINDLNEPDKEFPYKDKKSGFEIRELRNRNIAFYIGNRPNLHYPFYVNIKNKDKNGFYEIDLKQHKGWVEVFPKESQGYKTVWRWGKERSSKNLNTEIVAKKMNDGGFQIVEKYRKTSKMARSVWWDKEDNTEKGTLEVKKLFDGKVFDFPKSMQMIRKLVEMGTNTDDEKDIVLDFFAGSGTTGQAVLDLNKEDGHNRKFILVQLPEKTDEKSQASKSGYKNIADIGKERIRRVMKQIEKEQKEKSKQKKLIEAKKVNLDLGFKVFKLDKSNYEST